MRTDTPYSAARINRNIVECKYEIDPAYPTAFCELIETLWNVNLPLDIISQHKAIELIETLWNVNMLIFAILCVQIQN